MSRRGALLGMLALFAAVVITRAPTGLRSEEPPRTPVQARQQTAIWVRRPKVRLRAMSCGSGDGVPVLFVHGLAGNMKVWSAAMLHQSRTRRAGAFDLRGHGDSGLPTNGGYSIPSMAEDAASVAEALGFRRYVLVGHSLGAAVVAACAGRHPGRVAGVLFVEPPNRPSDRSAEREKRLLETATLPTYREQMKAGWGEALNPFPASHDRVLEALARTPPQAIGGVLAALAVYDPLPDLTRTRALCESLTVAGADNPRAYSTLVPSITHDVIDGTSHWIMLDAPEEFDRRLDGFLESVDRRERSAAKR